MLMNRAARPPRLRKRFRVAFGSHPKFTVDVSPGGFCAELMRVMAPGTQVVGLIEAKGQQFNFTGRVAWAKPGDARMNLRGRMGVQFIEIAPEFSAVLH